MSKRTGDLPPDRADKLRRMQEIRKELESLETEYDDLRDEVVIPWDGEPEFIIGDDGRKYRVSRIEGSDPVYHYEHLEDLTKSQREAITEVKIVGAKLKAEIQAGRIHADDALNLVSYRPKKPYPKFDLAE